MTATSRVHTTRTKAWKVGRVAAFAAAAAVGIVSTLSVAAPAMAHNFYISSTPAINQVLTTLPEQFIVTTNDNLLELNGAGGFFMEVTGPDGLYYGDGCVTVSGPSVTMPAALGPAGDYTLNWQVVSADGHTVSDVIPFRWQPTAADKASTPGSTTVPNCGRESVAAPDSSATVKGTDAVTTDGLWIGGAVLAVALSVVATLLILRPKKKDDDTRRSLKGTPEE